jgi:hypothetical protein
MAKRTLVRCLVVLLGCIIAASRIIAAVHARKEWRRWAIVDPSVADLYRGDYWVECAATGAGHSSDIRRLLAAASPPVSTGVGCGLTRACGREH